MYKIKNTIIRLSDILWATVVPSTTPSLTIGFAHSSVVIDFASTSEAVICLDALQKALQEQCDDWNDEW